jgi:predicted nuclease of predicted toxin-antitoxin system
MRLKVDENLGRWIEHRCRDAGHDVATVHDEGLATADDRTIFRACVTERRALITLDLDFSNPMRFDPTESAGIAVLRVPTFPTHADLSEAVETLLTGLDGRELDGHLWIVRSAGIREYDPGRS